MFKSITVFVVCATTAQGQIVGSVSWTLGVEWPPVFQEFLRTLSIFSLEALSPDCIGEGANFYRTVYFWSAVPVAISLLVILSFFLRSAVTAAVESDFAFTNRLRQLYASHLFYVLLLSYIVLPVSTLKQ